MSEITWRTEQRRVRDLLPYEFNPRTLGEEQHAHLTKSLSKFGLVEIPVVNTDNKLIAGHQRVRVLIELGRANDTIDVRVPSRTLTIEEFREYLVRSNKNVGDWDFNILANSFEIDDLKAWGFKEAELGLNFDEPAANEEPGGEAKPHQCPSCGFKWQD